MPEWLQNLDEAILLAIQNGLRLDVLSPVMVFYTRLGNAGLLWICLGLGMLFFKKTRRAGALALTAMALGFLCTNLGLKLLVQRPRPWVVMEGLVTLDRSSDPNSFPSGHTCAAFAAGIVWMRTLPWRSARIAAPVLAALMGFSRLYVGVHFPSDVLCGALVGTACACVVLRLVRRAEGRRGLNEKN